MSESEFREGRTVNVYANSLLSPGGKTLLETGSYVIVKRGWKVVQLVGIGTYRRHKIRIQDFDALAMKGLIRTFWKGPHYNTKVKSEAHQQRNVKRLLNQAKRDGRGSKSAIKAALAALEEYKS